MPTFSVYIPANKVDLVTLFKKLSEKKELGDFVIECVEATQKDIAQGRLKEYKDKSLLWEDIIRAQEKMAKEREAHKKQIDKRRKVHQPATQTPSKPKFWVIDGVKYHVSDYRLFIQLFRGGRPLSEIKTAFEKAKIPAKYPKLSVDDLLSAFQKDYDKRFGGKEGKEQ